MARLGLRLLGGIHSGSVIDLEERNIWTIGAGSDVDIFLADEDIADSHLILDKRGPDDSWRWTANEKDIYVFEHEVPIQTDLPVNIGLQITLRGVPMDFVRLLPETGNNAAFGVSDPLPHEVRSANLDVLRRINRKAYIKALVGQVQWLTYVLPALLSATAFLWIFRQSISIDSASYKSRKSSLEQIRQRYPDVHAALDEITGITTYTGYVPQRRDLNQLRSLAMDLDQGASSVQVVSMDEMASNASILLENYYRNAEIHVAGPGFLKITLPPSDAMRTLQSWDFPTVGERIKQALPELKEVDVVMSTTALKEVHVPLESLDFSLISLPGQRHLVITADGRRLFAGAHVKEGDIESITPCDVKLESNVGSTVFVMSNADTASNCPSQ